MPRRGTRRTISIRGFALLHPRLFTSRRSAAPVATVPDPVTELFAAPCMTIAWLLNSLPNLGGGGGAKKLARPYAGRINPSLARRTRPWPASVFYVAAATLFGHRKHSPARGPNVLSAAEFSWSRLWHRQHLPSTVRRQDNTPKRTGCRCCSRPTVPGPLVDLWNSWNGKYTISAHKHEA